MMLAVDVPNPVDVVTAAVTAPTGWAWAKVADGIATWILEAVGFFVDGVIGFLLTSARPDVEAVWFAGAGSPYATVRNMAAVTLAVFVFLGLIQGLLVGDMAGMVRRVAVDVPFAVLGMIATTVVVGRLIELTDALSATVLSGADGQAVHFLSGFGVAVNAATSGFAATLLGLVAVLAAFLVWVELMVRSVLVYVLVAVSPLSFAAMVWPAARGVLRRTVELLVAVILSKLVISIALAVGVAALSGAGSGGQEQTGVVNEAAMSLGTLLVGAAVLAIAAFAPFVLLRLIPMAEGAAVAYGVSRSPVRAAQATMSNAYQLSSVRRLAGGSPSGDGSKGGSGGGGSAGGTPRSGGPSAGGGGGSGARLAGTGAAAGAAVVATGAAAAVKRTANTASASVATVAHSGQASSASSAGQRSKQSTEPADKPKGGGR